MIKDNLTGIILSALLHAGLLSWAYAVNNEPVKQSATDNIVLTVSMFQEKVLTPAPVVKAVVKPVIKAIEEKITPPTPLNPEFADLPVVKIKSIKVKPKTPAAPPKIIVAKKPEVKKEEIKKQPKLAMLETIPELIKPKVIKKAIAKKKPLINKVVKKVVKTPVKKVVKRKIIKKILKPKVVKKKVQRKIVKRAKLVRKPQKRVIAKIKQRPRVALQPVKRVAKTQKSKKLGGVYSKNIQKRPQKAHQRAKNTAKYAKKAIKQSPRVVPRSASTNTAQNASLTKQFKARLQQLIASKKRYPKRAKRRGQQGRVTVSFRIRHSGIITDIRIVKGAKNKSLNKATITAIKQASGKLVYPKGMNKKSLTLTITLSYVLS